jgi:predicted TPR repeat methyltransferase
MRRADISHAITLHRAGNLKQAEQIYQGLLAGNPDHVEALHFMGVLLHQRGDSERARASIERAVALAPDYADAHNNLGNVLKESNHLDEALHTYLRVVELVPGHADAWNNLGVVLRSQGHYDEADRAYAHALTLKPALFAAWQNRGNLLARRNRFDEAITCYLKVLELRPRDSAAYDALGRSLYRSGKIEQAVQVYQKWLKADPTNSVARHMLAACSGSAAPERASDAYVRDVFDVFAGSFDQVLDQLGYRAPALIGEWLERNLAPPDGSLVIADAGCGTGLCADFLRPRARLLAGVDLSPGMLAKARARKTYDQLVEAELSSWLSSQQPVHDLIVSADTLCYFGELKAVTLHAASALKAGALLVFTVESAGDEVQNYQLNASGRYSHAARYVRECISEAGLHLLGIEQVELRRELGQAVGGFLVSARRPPAFTSEN